MAEPDVDSAAASALALARTRGPRCGATTLVLVDGPAGSGKTTFAAALERRAAALGTTCAVVHMDDLYAGWSGLRAGGAAATAMLTALAAGEPAGYRRYDWVAGHYAETVSVAPGGLLVVEGVGSARTEHLRLASVLVWVEEPDREERMRRGLARDGADAEPHWLAWMRDEARLFAEVGTPDRADLRLDGVGRLVLPGEPRS